jgi:ABC-2 type transport system ATP-binding protein
MINIEHLTKCFDGFSAVDDLSLQVGEGEVLGFLGPNGAGKSTTMKMITGFLAPTAGKLSVCGFDIEHQRIRAQQMLGYLPEGAPCYADMTVQQFLNFIAEIRGFRSSEKRRRVSAAVDKVSLQTVLERPIETLSKGFKRRVGLGQAILHDPKVLILDEPTDGLDPNQKQHVRELIENLSRDKIVIISTHILEEVTAVCTRAVIIAEGKLRSDGTPDELLRQSRYHNAINLHLTARNDAVKRLADLAGVSDLELSECGRRVVVLADQGQFIYPQVDDFIREHAIGIDNISVERGRLDEVFQRITRGGAQ